MPTWYALREFETRDITSRSYSNRHELELSATKAREISSSFIQAREYFRNASDADFTVRPLLMYYGVTSLARGLTLFLDPAKREASLKQGHGLQIRDWGQELSSGLAMIGNLRVRLTRGLFHDLLTSTNNKFYFRHNSSAVNWHAGAVIPPIGSEFALSEIAARIPDVSSQYYAWTGLHFPSVLLQSLQVESASGLCRITVATGDAEKVDSIFPTSHYPDRSVVNDGNSTVLEVPSNQGAFFAQSTGRFGIGDIVLFRPLGSNLYFSPLAACFMVGFSLGMLCRYFPTTWINVSRTEKGDAFYPLATRLMDWIEVSFPAMAVDILRGPYDFEKE